MPRPWPHLLLASTLLFAACTSDNCLCGEGVYTYAVSGASLPTTSEEAAEIGLDLDGDGALDNLFSQLLAAVVVNGVAPQTATAAAIDRGDIILLLQLQAHSFSSSAAGLQIMFGETGSAVPAPCANSTDPVCRRHLDGTGSFRVAESSPVANAVEGKIAGGTFNSSPGELSLELALGAPGKIRLDLIGARAKASGLSEAGLERVILAGGLPAEDLFPTFLGVLSWTVARDCPGTAPPDCGCEIGSSGRTILNLFDRSPQDCTLTVEELRAADLVVFKVAPDLTIDGRGAYSFGIELTAVKGTLR